MKRPSGGLLVLWLTAAALLGVGAVRSSAAAGPVSGAEDPDEASVLVPDAATDGTTDGTTREHEGATTAEDVTASQEAGPPQEAAPQAPADTATAPPMGPGVQSLDTPLPARLRSLLGLLLLALVAWLFSVDRRNIQWRVVLWGVALQLVFAVFILKTPVGENIFAAVNDVVVALLGFTVEGARFVFGDLVQNNVPVGQGTAGSNAPIEPVPGLTARTGAFFAFNVLPTIIFFSSLMTVLYHLGIMQFVVKGMAWVMQRTMRTSGAETLSAAGNIFVGQTEAPLLIKPFVDDMTMSELHAVMTGGFATVAGGVLAAYVGMLVAYFPDIAGHLMAASVMSAPAALVVAKLMYPEDGEPQTSSTLEIEVEKPDVNTIDAAARGASEGLGLALNVGAMLMAFLAMVYLLNAVLGWAGGVAGDVLVGLPLVGDVAAVQSVAAAVGEGLTMERILGWVLSPVAWLMGVQWAEASTVASLMGMKTVLNEFVAYFQLSAILGGDGQGLSPRSAIIATYALSGFANFSSIAIQLGGIGGIAPSRRHDLSRVGLRAMVAGSIAAFMTATVAGMLV